MSEEQGRDVTSLTPTPFPDSEALLLLATSTQLLQQLSLTIQQASSIVSLPLSDIQVIIASSGIPLLVTLSTKVSRSCVSRAILGGAVYRNEAFPSQRTAFLDWISINGVMTKLCMACMP